MNYRDPKTGKLKWGKLFAFSLIIFSVLSYLYVIGYIKLLRGHRFLSISTDPPREEVFFHLPSSAGYKALFFFYYPIIKTTSDGVIWV